jgi:hypothetical protein
VELGQKVMMEAQSVFSVIEIVLAQTFRACNLQWVRVHLLFVTLQQYYLLI